MTDGPPSTPPGSLAVLTFQTRDARLRERSRKTIRYELEDAARYGRVAPDRGADESWDVLCHARDVLELLRERDPAANGVTS